MPPIKKSPRERRRTYFTEWREFRELSQEQAAERLDIDRTTLSRIERGRSPYNQDTLEMLALAYGCDPEDLLTINPLHPNPAKRFYKELRKRPPDVQEKALEILRAFLKVAA